MHYKVMLFSLFLTSSLFAQNKPEIQCQIGERVYQENMGFHLEKVNASDSLLFKFLMTEGEQQSCQYAIQLYFKKAKPTRSMSGGGEEPIKYSAEKSELQIDLSTYVLIPIDKCKDLLGYVPFNAAISSDGKHYLVDRLDVQFQCSGFQKTFRFLTELPE